jgi:four helix bundle protein
MSSWKSFTEIDVWIQSREFCKDIYKIMQYDGLRTDYRLKDQINGSSGSIMDNIAEGFNRGGNKEFINFLSYSKGSAGESLSQLYRIFDRKYITESEFNDLSEKARVLVNKIGGLMAYLKKSGFKGPKFK